MPESEKEKMIAGELYHSFGKELVGDRARAGKLFGKLNSLGRSKKKKRQAILKALLGKCGKNLWIETPFYCDYGYQIAVGDNVFINFNCTILDGCPVTIGNNVLIGPNVQIYSATHPTDPAIRARGLEYAKPVTIEDHVWIGGGAVICPGVTIGSGTTIGAGSVVTRDVPPDAVAAGNPCRIIRRL